MDPRPEGHPEPSNAANDGGASRPSAAFAPVVSALERLRSAARRRLVAQKVAGIAGFGAVVVFVLALADYFVRLPMPVRVGHWVLGVGVLAWAVWRFVGPAIRFRPSLTDVALRVESSGEGVKRGLSGWLASALELSRDRADGADRKDEPQTVALSQRVVREAAERFRGMNPGVLLRTSASAQRGMVMLVLALLPVLGAAIFEPDLARVGVVRALWPFAGTAWPKRSAVIDATRIAAHPTTAALPIRAALIRGPGAMGSLAADEDVTLHARLIVGGVASRETRVLLTPQNRSVDVGDDKTGGVITGELFERLVEPATLIGATSTGGAVGDGTDSGGFQRGEIEYWFTTRDDATTPSRILLLQPPRVVAASARVTLPTYAQATPGALTQGEQRLAVRAGEGDAIGPVLAGSTVELQLTLSRPVPVPGAGAGAGVDGSAGLATPLDLSAESSRAFVFSTFAGAVPSGATATLDGVRWTIRWTAQDSTRLVVSPVDEHAIRAADDVVLRVNTVADRAPSVAIVEPARDEDVLPGAVIDATAEARDDVALAWASIMSLVKRTPADSAGAPPEATEPEKEVARVEMTNAAGDGAPTKPELATAKTTLELSTMSLKPGDEVWLTGVAADRFGFDAAGAKSDGSAARGPTRSSPRKLRIISEATFAEQVRAELQTLRQAAIRLEAEQGELAKQADALREQKPEQASEKSTPQEQSEARASKTDELTRAQRGIGERTEPQRELVRALAERVERNALSDADLRRTIEQSGEALDNAGESARRAADDLAAAAQSERTQTGGTPGEQAAKAQRDEAQAQQQRVRDELSRLIEQLDRGQDGWATRQSVQRLLDEQKRLTQQTREAGAATAGQAPDKLDATQRAELNQVASRQEDLARKAADAMDAMSQRGEEMSKTDPGQASAMARAAEQAKQRQLQDTMRRAAEQAAKNQTGGANELQKQAEETLEEMLKQLDAADSRRDEALQRMLVQVADSIRQLAAQQRAQIAALAAAEKGEGSHDGLAPAMVQLAQNTTALADSLGENQQMGSVLALLLAASESQSAAIVSLRAAPVDGFEADTHERASLAKLVEAEAEARKKAAAADQRENDRKREELAKAYRDALQAQQTLRDDTEGLIAKAEGELSRRDRAALRAIGEKQAALRETMSQLREKTEELKDAKLFSYAHSRYDRVAASAAGALAESRADAAARRDLASAVGVLKSLASALEEAKKNKDFRDGAGGQQGGQGGQGGGQQAPLLPPLTELRLLRMMQDDAMARTREASEGASDEAMNDAAALQRDLSEQGAGLLERLREQPGDGPAGEPPRELPKWHSWRADAPVSIFASGVLVVMGVDDPPPAAPATGGDPIPSLDELLGLPPEVAPPRRRDTEATPNVDGALERALSPGETKELFEEAVDLMGQTAARLERDRDAGAQTQRQQEDILRKLDKLIDESEKQQQQQQQQQSSSSSSSSDPKPNEASQQRQQQQQQQAKRGGESDQSAAPPKREDGPGRNAASGTASWGGLPSHVRDALMQGFSDAFSSRYKQMTEEYYKRLAEEKK